MALKLYHNLLYRYMTINMGPDSYIWLQMSANSPHFTATFHANTVLCQESLMTTPSAFTDSQSATSTI